MSKDTSRGRGKDVSLFEKGQIIGMHHAEKTSKEISETTTIELRTVQRIIKNWKDSGDPSSSRMKCGQKKILNDRDQRSLKRLVKSNRRKTTVELRSMFNSESPPQAAAFRSHFDDCPDSHSQFCFHGTCRFLVLEDTPACVCHPGFIGMRCEHADLLAVVATNQKQQTIATLAVVSVVGCVLLILLLVLFQ
ncbi:TGFA factor, partial [Polypterus senegalus]